MYWTLWVHNVDTSDTSVFPVKLPILSPPPCCLFIRQTICRKLCVFPRCTAPSARQQSSPNYLARAGSPAWAAAQRAEMKPACVFTPGSLSARSRVMVASGREFLLQLPLIIRLCKLISVSLWPAIICRPAYFMAHFGISASLSVEAELRVPPPCLYCVIGVRFLCSVPC